MPNHEPQLILQGDVSPSAAQSVRETAAALGIGVEQTIGTAEFAERLDAAEPLAVVGAFGGVSSSLDACRRLRTGSRLNHVPFFGIADERSDVSFLELYQWGGDDLIGSTAHSLLRRLRPLLAQRSSKEATRGACTAVVVGPDPQWRSHAARALFNAGVDVKYGCNAADAVDSATAVQFVIAAHDLAPEGAASAVAWARAFGSRVPWVIVTPPKQLAQMREGVAHLERVAVVDAFAPAENALFVANDLAQTAGPENRSDPRILHGAAVCFRAAGRDADEVGFTYNVSAGGLYVRTLAPLEVGEEVWLELRAPTHERRVRLSGRVAWRRPFARNASARVPPGFAVQIGTGLVGDLELWRAGCGALADREAAVPNLPRANPRRPSRTPSQLAPAVIGA